MDKIKYRNGIDLREAENKKCTQNNYTKKKKNSWLKQPQWCDHSPRARHPGMWSQVGLRKHHYEQS